MPSTANYQPFQSGTDMQNMIDLLPLSHENSYVITSIGMSGFLLQVSSYQHRHSNTRYHTAEVGREQE
jgi:hypothetical protein